ncbi:MAG: hypothetical protein JWO03_2386 [Bacteroidetes bacterium]|nr:hypothetical protein [Bacteroidota bacterium]
MSNEEYTYQRLVDYSKTTIEAFKTYATSSANYASAISFKGQSSKSLEFEFFGNKFILEFDIDPYNALTVYKTYRLSDSKTINPIQYFEVKTLRFIEKTHFENRDLYFAAHPTSFYDRSSTPEDILRIYFRNLFHDEKAKYQKLQEIHKNEINNESQLS